MLLALLILSSFFLAFLKGLKHGGHICQPFLAPTYLVGLMFIVWFTSGCTKGITILIIMVTLDRIVGLVGAIVRLAYLTKLLGTRLLRDSIRQASSRCASFGLPHSRSGHSSILL